MRSRPGRYRRRGALLTVGAVASLLLSGCAGLSTDSSVMPGLPVGVEQQDNVRIVPPEPILGASPEQIVRGFVRGGAASDGAYDTARSFLSRRSQPVWRPDTSVTIFASGPGLEVTAMAEDTVRVTAPALATIDADGRYTESPGRSATADFTVERSSGEWRIASVPDTFGLWLGSFDADRLFRPYTVNYVSVSGRRLVPDVRWFSAGTGLVTRLARAQLGAVPAYLQGAAVTAVPDRTELAVDAVLVENGVATVDLGAADLGTETVARQNLWAQFYATVAQAPGVTRVLLRQEGADLALPGVDGAVVSLREIGFPTRPARPEVPALIRTDSTVRSIDPQQLGEGGLRPPVEQRDDLPVIGPGWGALALSADGGEIAGVGQSRGEITRWLGRNQLSLPVIGSQLTPPTYDEQRILWVAGLDDRGRGSVWAIKTGDEPQDSSGARPQVVEVPWLLDRLPEAIRVSSDGTRIVVISTDADGGDTRVDIAGIRRGSDTVPVGLSDPMRTALRLITAKDAVWVGDTTLAVIGTADEDDETTPWVVEVGGPSEALPAVAGAKAITTVSGERGLIVTTDDDDILIRAGNSWLSIGDGSSLLAAAT